MNDMGESTVGIDKGRGDLLRVIPDAVIGGGVDLRAGQIVHESDLGAFVDLLKAQGAVVSEEEHPADR